MRIPHKILLPLFLVLLGTDAVLVALFLRSPGTDKQIALPAHKSMEIVAKVAEEPPVATVTELPIEEPPEFTMVPAPEIPEPEVILPPPTPSRTFSIRERMEQYGELARERMRASFEQAGVAYPPKELTLLGLKEERLLQVYAKSEDAWVQVLEYPILAASGIAGPKLREGDEQVPEGIYPVELLNPNSRFHLSLRVGYPSTEDRKQARKEKRENLGSDIMIHGGAVSIGCVAIGDPAIEEVFILAADVGIKRIRVLLAPCDLRAREIPETAEPWIGERYSKLAQEMNRLPAKLAPEMATE